MRMNNKSHFTTHTAAVTALYIFGNGVILFPFLSANKYTLLAYIFCSVLSFAIYFILLVPANKLFSTQQDSKSIISRIGMGIVYFSVAIFSLFVFARSFKIFIRFASDLLFKGELLWLAAVVFALVVLVFASHRQENILKFVLISFVCILPVVLFFFFASFENFEIENIVISRFPNFNELWINSKPYIKEICIPLIILPVYQALVFHKNRVGATTAGLAIGTLFLGLCVASSLLLFGSTFALKIEYPYAAAVSTVSIGRLFTRMDYFSYFIYFATSVTRITVCIFTAKECLKRMAGLFFKI